MPEPRETHAEEAGMMRFASADSEAIPLHVLNSESLREWLEGREEPVRRWLELAGFTGAPGEAIVVPEASGAPLLAVAGIGDEASRRRLRFPLAKAAARLPGGIYRIESGLSGDALARESLGWLLESYRFNRYREQPGMKARLAAPGGVDAARLETIAAGERLSRDLINTPPNDMGPAELEATARSLAEAHGADLAVIAGDDLLAANLPMIHAVGRASPRTPRLLDLRWGDAGPRLTLVGKGVCFDTGGLNLKPGASMGLMKKDMGGAATVLGLAKMIMALGLPVRLRVLIPAVENAIDGAAMRPQDILKARNGLTVEINNTDAEGRLVLADALALGDEEKPDLMLSMATLTGAARVALGPDLPPFFTDDEPLAAALAKAAEKAADPLWRMPFWEPYEEMLEPGIADLDNAPKGGFAGAVTAALFLRRFVRKTPRYAHFDIYGWQPKAAPGRPKGGVGQGARAVLEALPEVFVR